MTKKDFIALADAIRNHGYVDATAKFNWPQLRTLAEFCQSRNPQFNRQRWLAYIAGECGPNGGAIKPPKVNK